MAWVLEYVYNFKNHPDSDIQIGNVSFSILGLKLAVTEVRYTSHDLSAFLLEGCLFFHLWESKDKISLTVHLTGLDVLVYNNTSKYSELV